jgi:hypothetical protein
MKFRQLSIEELEGFKEEFVQFLIVQGIDADEWQRIKGDEPLRAVKMVGDFSDFIFSSIVSKVKYIEYFEPISLKLFKCEPETIHLMNISTQEVIQDLSTFLNKLADIPENFEIQRVSKNYYPDRHTEIFRMINGGGHVSDGKIYESLSDLID